MNINKTYDGNYETGKQQMLLAVRAVCFYNLVNYVFF